MDQLKRDEVKQMLTQLTATDQCDLLAEILAVLVGKDIEDPDVAMSCIYQIGETCIKYNVFRKRYSLMFPVGVKVHGA